MVLEKFPVPLYPVYLGGCIGGERRVEGKEQVDISLSFCFVLLNIVHCLSFPTTHIHLLK